MTLAAIAAAGIAGCGGGGGSVLSTPPTTNAPQTTVTVFTSEMLSSEGIIQVPLVGGTVTLSRSIIGTTPQTPLANQTTDTNGQATFAALPSTGPLCVSIKSQGTFASKCRTPFPGSVTLQVASQT